MGMPSVLTLARASSNATEYFLSTHQTSCAVRSRGRKQKASWKWPDGQGEAQSRFKRGPTLPVRQETELTDG